MVMVEGRGSTLIDSEGNEYIDGMAGLWCVNVGYGQERLVEAAANQMRRLPYTSLSRPAPVALELAEHLTATKARLPPQVAKLSTANTGKLCVVETPADQSAVERTAAFRGLYFVLMGKLSPLDGIGPKEIRLERLLKRATDGTVREVVLATNFTNEGEATAHTIGELLTARGLAVTRLARGVPVGGELEFVAAGTLAQAVRERRSFDR